MKKFVVLLVVVALTCVSAMAFAAEVTVGGSVEVRSRNFSNMDFNDDATDTDKTSHKDTQTRMKIDVNAKAGDVKGKLSLWNDFETWGDNSVSATSFETQPGSVSSAATTTLVGDDTPIKYNNNTIGFREAWVSFNLPGIPVNVTAGHQLLTLGNGWFFRSMHFGSDAWVISNQTGPNTAALVNVKFAENTLANADDKDAYVLLDVFKLSDTMTVGADITYLHDRSDKTEIVNLQNLGVNFNGKLGPVALKAEVDLQMGEVDNAAGDDPKFKGNQVVLQGSVPLDPVTVNFTVARGTGSKATDTDIKGFQNLLDVDPHYTAIWEYKVGHPGVEGADGKLGAKNFGFANTTAIGVGATFAATSNLTVGADFWQLMSSEDIPNKAEGTGTTDEIGAEIDLKVNWKVAENLTWNWVVGYLMAGDGLGKDDATGVQGALTFKF